MPRLFETVTDLRRQADVVRRRRYGVLEIAGGRFVCLRFRPYPKMVSLPEITVLGRWYHRYNRSNRLLVYIDQPRQFPNFLTVKYVLSGAAATFASCHRAARLVDEIARIKRSDALLCDVSNLRISDRLMRRWGWESHKPQRWRRNYIKRFYGEYPPALSEEEFCEPAEPLGV